MTLKYDVLLSNFAFKFNLRRCIWSPQFDDQNRGFRPEQDGPLDLRFDTTRGVPASEFLQGVERVELVRILAEYGETTDAAAARRIADAICIAREAGPVPMLPATSSSGISTLTFRVSRHPMT